MHGQKLYPSDSFLATSFVGTHCCSHLSSFFLYRNIEYLTSLPSQRLGWQAQVLGSPGVGSKSPGHSHSVVVTGQTSTFSFGTRSPAQTMHGLHVSGFVGDGFVPGGQPHSVEPGYKGCKFSGHLQSDGLIGQTVTPDLGMKSPGQVMHPSHLVESNGFGMVFGGHVQSCGPTGHDTLSTKSPLQS